MKKTLTLTLCCIATTLSAGTSNYLLKTGEADVDRLNKQHEFIREDSVAHLAKAGISLGQIVADIGCGSGAMTAYFAKKVGPQGHVYAVDESQAQLDVTRKKMEKEGCKNVSYIKADMQVNNPEALRQIADKVDLAYTRLVLMHLKHPDIAVRNMLSVLKKGGRAASQETIHRLTYSVPESDFIKKRSTALLALGKKSGVNFNIGEDLAKLYKAAGFTIIDYYKKERMYPAADTTAILMKSTEDFKERYLEAKILTPAEFDKIREDAEKVKKTDTQFAFTGGYVIAEKA